MDILDKILIFCVLLLVLCAIGLIVSMIILIATGEKGNEVKNGLEATGWDTDYAGASSKFSTYQ